MEAETLEQFIYSRHTKQSAKTYLFNLEYYLAIHPNARNYKYKDIVDVVIELQSRYPNPRTRNGILSAIKRYYDYLIATKQRNDHPCKNFRIKGDRNKRSQVHFQDLFSPAEMEQLLDRPNRYENLRLRNKIIISFLIYQGMVSENIVRLTLSDIDLDKGTVYIKAGAKLSRRTLQLTRLQREYIQEYIHSVRKKIIKVNSDRLLIAQRGEPETVDGINRMLIPLRSTTPGKVLNPQTIRMSVIANWLNVNKYKLEDVQLMAGHHWPSSTFRYKRQDINEQREKINKWHPLK